MNISNELDDSKVFSHGLLPFIIQPCHAIHHFPPFNRDSKHFTEESLLHGFIPFLLKIQEHHLPATSCESLDIF
jgi:hypothetical protein